VARLTGHQPPGARVGREEYRPADPHAYAVRPSPWLPTTVVALAINGLVSGALLVRGVTPGPLAVAAGCALCLSTPVLFRAVSAARGEVRFAVDAGGVFFGAAGPGDPYGAWLVPWAEVVSIVLFDLAERGGGRAIGVTAVPVTGGEPVVGCYRVMRGWRIDRARLEAATRHLAPQVPVVDGPLTRR